MKENTKKKQATKKKTKTQSKSAGKKKAATAKSSKEKQPLKIPPGVGLPENPDAELYCTGCNKTITATMRRDCLPCVYEAVRQEEFNAWLPAMALRELKRKTSNARKWFHAKVVEEVGERYWPSSEQLELSKSETFRSIYDSHTRNWKEAQREALEDESLPPIEAMLTPSVEWLERQPDWHPRREKRKRMALVERELEIFRRKNLPDFHPLKLETADEKAARAEKEANAKKQTAKKATTKKKAANGTTRRKEAAK